MSEHQYMPILDNRRLDDELAEARRILNNFRLKFTSGNSEPVKSRHIEAIDVDVRDITAFFERWPWEACPDCGGYGYDDEPCGVCGRVSVVPS